MSPEEGNNFCPPGLYSVILGDKIVCFEISLLNGSLQLASKSAENMIPANEVLVNQCWEEKGG